MKFELYKKFGDQPQRIPLKHKYDARTEVNRKACSALAEQLGSDSASKATLSLRHNMMLISANKPLQESPLSNYNHTLPLQLH